MTMIDWLRRTFPPLAPPLGRPAAPRRPLATARGYASPGTVYLDTETTGLGADARIVEVAIADDTGLPLVNTLVDPGIAIPYGASAIHGIFDEDVAGMPSIQDLMPRIDDAIGGRRVVIYNVSYDQRLFPCRLSRASAVLCAMRRFKQLPVARGSGNGTLSRAADWAGHRWSGAAHRAMADALATRTVWQMLEAHGVPVAER